eukprot:TRINITY_DN2103_c0_g1_i2.p1 TRINITY_DN2103_c0_g1~~TRINITY_DN2103_c0_g1_i2.p1  ORF type:complete len:666 (+),score=164.43 TRINITY_DN2103_c0_g1_i2:48-2000(+)
MASSDFLPKQLPPEREGESSVYRSPYTQGQLLETFWPGVSTLYDGFQRTVKNHGSAAALGWREGEGPYKWITYNDINKTIFEVGSALVNHCGLSAKSFVGLFSVNRKEWVITEHACYTQSLVPVPLYDTLGPDASKYIINQTEMQVLVVSKTNIKKIKDIVSDCPSLKFVIQMDDEKDPKVFENNPNITFLTLNEIAELGQEKPAQPAPPSPSDLATICYTSGTTGDPKGVMLSHRAIIADISGAMVHGIDINSDDVYISYLPLAHMMERVILNAILLVGASAGFFRGDVVQLFDDLIELKPTLFVSVPRLFNRVYDKVLAAIAQGGALKGWMFNTALQSKNYYSKQGYLTHTFWDPIVFAKIRDRLGGRVRLMLTGSAPISAEVMDFLRGSFSVGVLEGYGQTETAACATCTLPTIHRSGNVGIPIPSAEIKLVDVPEMGYTAKDSVGPRGEVCIRGPICCEGYFKNEEKTKELFDEHGWLHTGDVGLILPDGTLKIIDRKKNIFKLSQGEYVAPEKIENTLCRIPYIAQAYIHGESLMSTLVAVFVPDFEILIPWAKENKIDDVSPEALCKNTKVSELITQQVKEISASAKLHGFEIPKAFHLSPELFSVENDLLTPTFKLKRPQAKAKYLEEIRKMYQQIEPNVQLS